MEEDTPEYPQDALGDSWAATDPFQLPDGDPWRRPANATGSHSFDANAREFEPQFGATNAQPWGLALPADPVTGGGYPRNYAGGGPAPEHAHRDGPVQRFALDNPPTWDGKHPETQAEPYFKKLKGWLMTSRTLKSQQGMQILSACAPGSDLELVVNELHLDTLTRDDGGRIVYEHICTAYKEYIELTMTKHLVAALYSDQCRRSRGETLLSYTSRRQILFRYLENSGIGLPNDAKG